MSFLHELLDIHLYNSDQNVHGQIELTDNMHFRDTFETLTHYHPTQFQVETKTQKRFCDFFLIT